MTEGILEYLDQASIFEYGNLLNGLFVFCLITFLIFLTVRLIKISKKGNKLASHLAKALVFYLLSYLASALGAYAALIIHDENIFKYVHFYSTVPDILLTLLSVYWLYRLYVEIDRYTI